MKRKSSENNIFSYLCIMNFRELSHKLSSVYDDREAKAIARMVFEIRYGLTLSDIVMGRDEAVPQDELEAIAQRLLNHEPVQYVLGVAEFCEHQFLVGPGVLIPRPETQWLCDVVSNFLGIKKETSILDIGTGSGCIACTCALDLAITNPLVVGWDISDEALNIARKNAERLGAKVTFVKQDIMQPTDDHCRWDVIISNPPYVLYKERARIEHHVLDYEPKTALFVPDDNPLLFYRAIAYYASQALKDNGLLAVEINRAYGTETRQLLLDFGFKNVCIFKDDFGNDRYVTANL